jgi:hypothetical protein
MPYDPTTDQTFALAVSNDAMFGAVGEAQTITLKARNQTTGAMDSTVATIAATSWSKERVKMALGGFTELFHVIETALTDAEAEATVLVTHGSKNYKVKLAAKPSGFDRYYLFEIQPV